MADSNWSVRIGTRVTDDIQKQLNAMPKKTVTVKAVLDNTGLKTIGTTELTKYEDALGNVVVANKKFDASGKELNNTIKSVKSTVDTTSQTLQTASKHTKTLGQDFIETAGKVAKFGAITAIFGLVTTAIGSAIKSVKELDSAMVEFNKVSSLSGSGLDNYTKKLGELGLEVARTKEDMVEASTEFVKAGYTEEESAKLAKTASLFQNIADTELSASEASTVLISNMKAFGMTSADSERVVDVINEVSNLFAVSSSDISAGLSKTASAMSTLGNTYEQSIALMVGAGEQMPNQSGKIARGLRSIGLEIVKTAKQTRELETGYGDVTLSLYDQNGALKSTFDIMSELYPTWQKMTNEQKTNLGISLAGKQQYEVFSATMEGFDQVLKANEVGLNAMGSAMKENEAYMDGLEARTKLLQAQFDLLVNGDGGFNSFLKGILATGTALLKFANSDIGGAVLQISSLVAGAMLLTTVMGGLSKSIIVSGTTASLMATGLTALEAQEAIATGTTLTLGNSIKALTVSMLSNPLFLGTLAVVGGIYAIVKAVDFFNETLEESRAKLEEEKTKFSEASEAAETTNSKLEDVRKKIQEINELGGANVAKDGELERLKYQETTLSNILALEINRKNIANEDLETQAKKTIGKEVSSRFIMEEPTYVDEETGTAGGATVPEWVTRTDEIIAGSNALKEYQATVVEIEESFASGKMSQDEYSESIGSAKDKVQETNTYLQEMSDSLLEDVSGLDETSESYKIVTKATSSFSDALVDSGIVTEEQLGLVGELGDGLDETKEQFGDMNNEAKESTSTFSDIQSAYNTLVSAMDEYNESGVYSLDTVSKLLSLDSEYLSSLQLVNGQITLNEEAIRNKVIAQAEETKQEIYSTAIKELNAIASADSGEASKSAGDDHLSAVSGINAETESFKENTIAKLQNAIADAKGRGASTDEVNQVLGEMSSKLALVNKAVLNMGTSFEGSMGKASKASSKASKSTKDAWKEAYESDKKELDRNLKTKEISEEEYYKRLDALNEKYFNNSKENHEKYIEDYQKNEEELYTGQEKLLEERFKKLQENVKDEIDIVKDAKDKALDAIKEEKDAKLDSIDKQLNKLKEQKDTESDYWDKKIDAFKAQNKQLENQNELMRLQEALSKAEATQKLVMTDTGWDYGSDESAVADAQQAIDDYNQNLAYETQLAELEQSKEDALAIYDEKIADLEAYRESVSDNYDAQIKQTAEFYDLQITQLQDMVDQYNEQADALLNRQYDEVDDENSNWRTRLENLASFINSYNKMLSSLGVSGKKVSSNYNGLTSAGLKKAKEEASTTKGYASGVASVGADEVAMIGDNPSNRELVIGSKLNGTATMLSQGSGVVNAQSTKTLAGILNTLGSSMGLNGQTIGATTTNQSNATSQSIQIANITLPSVTNGQGLLDELRGFASGMLQTAYSNT